MKAEPRKAGAREYRRSAALLTVAIGLSGGLIYLFFALASHALDRDEYGRIVVLWSAMFLVVSILCRPIEQFLSYKIAESQAVGPSTSHSLRVSATIQAGLVVSFVLVAFGFRRQIESALFDGDSLYFWSLVGSVVGFGLSFFARGDLAGSKRFVSFAGVVLIDSASRAALALAVAIGIAEGEAPLALGIAAAPFVSVIAWPASNWLARRRGHASRKADLDAGASTSPGAALTLSEGSVFAGAMVAVMLSEQSS